MNKISWIIMLSIVLFVGCRNEQTTQTADVSVPVRVADVTKKTIYNTLTINGTVSPVGTVDVVTEAEGRYSLSINPSTRLPYKMGDKVKKGEKLVSLSNEEYELGIRIESRKLDLENSKQEYEKQKSLYEKGGVTMRELQNSELSYINTKYDYENAQMQINKLSVFAPFDGVIVELPYFTQNVRVSSGTKVARLMDYSALLMQAEFPEKFITTITTGQEAYITNYNLRGDTLKALITQLSPAINEASRTFRGVMRIDNPSLIMRPGMFVKADIVVERRDSAVVVPRELVQSKRRGKVVFVIERNTAVEKRVETGIETDTEVEIISGLELDEKLVTEGYQMLSNRTKVRVQN
jgi:membrane fusion protein, multidrug efflux system